MHPGEKMMDHDVIKNPKKQGECMLLVRKSIANA
jgi:hypothetical protein